MFWKLSIIRSFIFFSIEQFLPSITIFNWVPILSQNVFHLPAEVKVSRNGPERRSGKRIIAGTAFRLEFPVGWYYDADATMAVPELY